MNRTRIGVVLMAWLIIVVGTCVIPSSTRATDIDQMVASAKTAADHQAIANYYDQQAAEARDQIARHQKMSKAYESSPGLRSAGPSYWRVGAKDCDVLKRSYQNIAAQDEALAKMHREMATQVSGAP